MGELANTPLKRANKRPGFDRNKKKGTKELKYKSKKICQKKMSSDAIKRLGQLAPFPWGKRGNKEQKLPWIKYPLFFL
ncbi:MAG: hypothetical protein MI749_05875 [Desulfovibrionales bacterium]|nr:hypothetical protein [Desulfovibrionales bacterium]